MICYNYSSSASEKCNNCKTLTELKQYQQSWEGSHVQYVTARPICIYCSSSRTPIHSRIQSGGPRWAQSNCDPLSCRSAPSPASDTLVSLAGGDIKQKLKFHQIHLELGALGYIETFLFYWSWVFFNKKKHHGWSKPVYCIWSHDTVAQVCR